MFCGQITKCKYNFNNTTLLAMLQKENTHSKYFLNGIHMSIPLISFLSFLVLTAKYLDSKCKDGIIGKNGHKV